MGIEKFFNNLKSIYGNKIITELNDDNILSHLPTKYLLIDFNSVIHNVSQNISSSLRYLYHIYLISNTNPSILTEKNINFHINNIKTIDNFILESKIVLPDQATETEATTTTTTTTTATESDTNSKFEISINFKDINLEMISEPLFRLIVKDDNLDKLVIQKVSEYVYDLLKYFPKLELLYLAIDGVPLFGKMIEQKKRRTIGYLFEETMKEILELYKKELNVDGSLSTNKSDVYYNHYQFELTTMNFRFLKSKISPGTNFMRLLEENIMIYLAKVSDKLKIVLDSYNNPGEGEKKIVFKIHEFKNSDIMVYSPDADVILLMLLEIHDNNIKIMRYDQQSFKIEIIDISKLKDQIIESIYYLLSLSNCSKKIDSKNIIKDVVMLFTIFGNDFLPKLYKSKLTIHYKNLMASYAELIYVNSDFRYIFTNLNNSEHIINWKYLKEFFIIKNEMDNKSNKKYPYKKYRREWKLEPDQIINSNAIPYYKHKFNIENITNTYEPSITEDIDISIEEIYKSTDKYLQGLVWLTKYYLDHELKYNNYYYNLKYVPTLNQIIYNLKNIELLQKDLENLDSYIIPNNRYFNPIKQLMFITPYDVSDIIDKKYLTDELQKFIVEYNLLYNKPFNIVIKNNKANIYDYLDCKDAFYLSKCEINNLDIDDAKNYLLKKTDNQSKRSTKKY